MVAEIARRKLDDPKADVSDLVGRLGSDGKTVYSLMVNTDPEATRGLVAALNPRIRGYFDDLTLAGRIDGLRCRLIIGHGRDDDLIPYTESLKLAGSVPYGTPVHLAILESFHHVDLELGGGKGFGGLVASVAELGRLYSITYDLVAQRRVRG